MSNYRILLRGVKPGRSIDDVVEALARYSKKSPEKLRELLSSGKHMVAKRTTQGHQATQYKLFLEKLGCDCIIEAEITPAVDGPATTSVLVTDAETYDAVPRHGVTYTQKTRIQEWMESIARAFRSRAMLGLVVLAVLYVGWQHLQ